MDYGAAVKSGQDIQYNRLRNEALGMEVQEAEDMLRNRTRANEIRQQFRGLPDQIEKLEDAGMFDEADKVRDTYIKQSKAEVELIGAMRSGITEDNYDEVRGKLIRTGAITPELWPVEYSDDWFRDQQKDRAGNLTKLTRKWAEQGSIMSQDLVQQDGSIVWEGVPYADPDDTGKDGKGGAFKFTASDSNAIGKQSERLYGGFYDPTTGRISGLDRDKAQKVAQVQAEAERLYSQAEGSITHAIALAQAARKFSIKIEDAEDSSTYDPLNLGTKPGAN
jgi:hypothetical protein